MTARRLALTFIIFGVVASLFGIGLSIGYKYPGLVGLERKDTLLVTNGDQSALSDLIESADIDFDIFWDVWELAQTKHYDRPADSDDLITGAINGLLQFGLNDRFSSYLPPELSSTYSENLGGEFGGVGLELDVSSGALTVVSPIENGSAFENGILPGDIIVAIDDQTTDGLTVLEAITKIRGKIGTQVKLGMIRVLDDGTLDEFSVSLERSEISSQTISWDEKIDGVYYIKIRNFSDSTKVQWDNTVDSIKAADPTGIILDLRSNAGGSIEPVVDIVSDFVHEGIVYVENFGEEDKKEISVSGQGRLYDVPLVVLINSGTASAAEIVAGALQDHGRTVLIGTRSFGKGVIQKQFDVTVPGQTESALLNLVIAKWYTPDGTWVQEEGGLEPDIEQTITPEQYKKNEDLIYNKAIEEIQKLIASQNIDY